MSGHRRRGAVIAALVSLIGGLANAQETRAAASWARITYLSGETVYLEVGRNDGLTERSVLEVVRGGVVVATLRVTALSSSRASCEIVPPPVELTVGDSVRFVPDAAPTPATARAATAASKQSRPFPDLHGRVGVRYLVVAPAGDAGGGLTQPAYDLRLDGRRLGGTGFGAAADLRAQRTQYAASSRNRADANATRVYLAAMSWSARSSGLRLTVGRQLAGALSSVGIFDGVAVDVERSRWSTGAFAGSQPDAFSFGLSGKIREYGAYLGARTAGAVRQSAALTVGGVGSYAGSAVDREYAFVRVTSSGPYVSLYATQELDFNRGWKRQVESAALTPTASFVSLFVQPHSSVTISAGFDNRRSVRLYRDFQNPEVAFDDAFREGTWAGVSVAAPRHVRLGVDRRDSRGGAAGRVSSTNFTGAITGLTRAQLGFRARGTAFSGPQTAGALVSGAVDIDPWGVVRVEANGGQRRTNAGLVAASHLTWWGVDADISIRRTLYLLLSAYHEREPDRASMQTYASLSWRF